MSEEKKKHPVLKAAAVTATAAAAGYGGFSWYVFREAFDLEHSHYQPQLKPALQDNRMRNSEWLSKSTRIDDYINSFDSIVLHAMRIANHPESHKWVIVLHGYHNSARDMLNYAYEADQRGYNTLLIDSRGCGASKGRYTSLGWLEHYDLISWISYLNQADPEAQIALVGVCMGASTIMNAVGDYMNESVKCAVEDSGYSEIRDELIDAVGKSDKFPSAAFVPGIDLFVKNILHFSIYEISTKRQLMQARVPMLFVHAAQDSIVPAGMMDENFAACASEKQQYLVEGVDHQQTQYAPGYFDRLFEFIDAHMTQKA